MSPLTIATSRSEERATVWLLPYRETKQLPQGIIRKAETFSERYDYYTVALNMPEGTTSCPLMNEAGEVIGLMQHPYKQGDSLSYAVSALFADSLRINGLSINDPTLRSTSIKKDLPEELSQAVLTLYVAQASADSAAYVQMVEDFINRFPDAPDGYTYRAQMETNSHQFDAASRDMEQAIKVAEKKDEAHFNYSKLIYEKEIYMNNVPYDGWSLDKALEEAKKANMMGSLANKFKEADEVYASIMGSELRSAELFYECSRCKAALNDTIGQIAMLDSCKAMFSQPYLKEAAPYLLARAQVLMESYLSEYPGDEAARREAIFLETR